MSKKQKKKWSACTLREIDPAIWARFKSKCARLKISMKQRLMDLIERDIRDVPK